MATISKHESQVSQQPWRRAEIGRRLRSGVRFGTFVGVGLMCFRFALMLFAGHFVRADSLGDSIEFVLLYVGASAAAGGLIGALWPIQRSNPGRFLLAYLGAGVAFTILVAIIMRMQRDYDPVVFAIVVGVMTLIFGTVFARWLRAKD